MGHKMITGGTKGLGAVVVAWLTYINSTFSPLFWVLLVLIFIDILLNIHKEGQQLHKLASMAISLGIPTYVSENIGQPHLGKYIVAILCLGYLQVVVPEIIKKVGGFKFSKDPKQNALDQETAEKILKMLADREKDAAQEVIDSAKQATTPGVEASDEVKGGA